ncbi:protoporphyrinogen oxidase HemJ [Tianweitania sp. BSSL-BM11]|uniref:Protoporphyrinogen IX oxidase n=1 Tax=Tianweitania aestuarii TaxID=2814886 RepID=A0ABS5RZ99_9HYPH|nr:protoporphyrinogen oxidase HemJ [Tianweitania aestuarii]MBS9721636.1 protoporphyrinogen oxidase HemJ [Tianweitania aestuarii]
MRGVLAILISAAGLALLFALAGDGFYPWAKAIHVMAVISWMAGMFYLPRLFVYHADTEIGTPQSETFKVMERRLLRAIINPAMIVTWIFGIWLAWRVFAFSGGWLHAKIALVLVLSGLHGYLTAAQRRFEADQNLRPSRHWRMINEVPTLLMVLIVILVIVKPF